MPERGAGADGVQQVLPSLWGSFHAQFKGAVGMLIKHLDDNNLKLLLNPFFERQIGI